MKQLQALFATSATDLTLQADVKNVNSLPKTVRKVKKKNETELAVSESFAECDGDDVEAAEMVKGNMIIPLEPHKSLSTGSVQPLLFKVQESECLSLPEQHATPSNTTPTPTPTTTTKPTPTTTTTVTKEKLKKPKEKEDKTENSGKGVIKYMLSNREFIEKGWTLLPTTTIMRRMNIYKMEPANPKFDWFDRHKTQKIYYDTGEKFAEIEETGSGKWYYKNGALALDYYCAQDSNDGQRFVVYSSGENTDAGRRLPVTVLASFDYLGNGVVYDHYGNERLKYNQSEGIVFDEKIGPPGRWKWHSLNEPPVLQPVFMDNHVRSTGCLQELLRGRKHEDTGSKHKKEPNLDMLAIELEHFVKEKAEKLLLEFKPFQIKMKVLKVNDQFSLKVLDQASIYLIFRDGHTSIKLNLGMLLISNKIVDTDTADVNQVATPYDRHPPKSESIADIQITLEKARKLGKARGKRHY
ncbi:hypothetical protein ABMA28_000098 [Loxostege sticticalis]|uniref:FAM194 C-terminal domain-containing protein n=1 Tax=Loxostege sticticalis TaxID=481309 RepID=A0ABD0TR12_LOXSC